MRCRACLIWGCLEWILLWETFYQHAGALSLNWLTEKGNASLYGSRSNFSGAELGLSRGPSLMEADEHENIAREELRSLGFEEDQPEEAPTEEEEKERKKREKEEKKRRKKEEKERKKEEKRREKEEKKRKKEEKKRRKKAEKRRMKEEKKRRKALKKAMKEHKKSSKSAKH